MTRRSRRPFALTTEAAFTVEGFCAYLTDFTLRGRTLTSNLLDL
jgi:hypothetical protein